MSIVPLPQFEADLAAYRREQEEAQRASQPHSIVVRFGSMKMIGEFPYDGKVKPGCGSKLVVRTQRGTEMGDVLTVTCPNAGCSKSITRKEMLEYIENSGGTDYPFFEGGRALRIATAEDMLEQQRLEGQADSMRRKAQAKAVEHKLPMKIVQAEPILGGERLTFHFTSEERIDFRDLVRDLAQEFSTRIEMRQVGARDEARLIADYERCGQHCCCKQFLKVLKPISIKAAKMQKATLDPLKISGRCGRLMCCLRYEDETYDQLSKRLPKMKKRVGTPHGIGIVIDRQILTQLVLVRLEEKNTTVAVPVEEIVPPEEVDKILLQPSDPLRGMPAQRVADRAGPPRARHERQDAYRGRSQREDRATDSAPEARHPEPGPSSDAPDVGAPADPDRKKRRRRRRRKGGQDRSPRDPNQPMRPSGDGPEAGDASGPTDSEPRDSAEGSDEPLRRKRRRRRRRRGSGGGGGGGGGEGGNPDRPGGDGGSPPTGGGEIQ